MPLDSAKRSSGSSGVTNASRSACSNSRFASVAPGLGVSHRLRGAAVAGGPRREGVDALDGDGELAAEEPERRRASRAGTSCRRLT